MPVVQQQTLVVNLTANVENEAGNYHSAFAHNDELPNVQEWLEQQVVIAYL